MIIIPPLIGGALIVFLFGVLVGRILERIAARDREELRKSAER